MASDERTLPVPFLIVLVALLVLLGASFLAWLGMSVAWPTPTPAQSGCLTTLGFIMTSILGGLLGLLAGKATS